MGRLFKKCRAGEIPRFLMRFSFSKFSSEVTLPTYFDHGLFTVPQQSYHLTNPNPNVNSVFV